MSFDQRAWYAIGYHAGRNQVRRLKLNRFTDIKLTDKPYAIPDDFSLAAFRGKAWRMIRGDNLYKIEIEFDPKVAETVADTHWHATQEIDDHPDGSITFRCEVEGLDEIVWWILGYGPHAKVLKPKTLACLLKQKAQATARLYASDASSPIHHPPNCHPKLDPRVQLRPTRGYPSEYHPRTMAARWMRPTALAPGKIQKQIRLWKEIPRYVL